MQIVDYNLPHFKRATWAVNKGKFSTLRIDDCCWYGSTKFYLKGKYVWSFSKKRDWMSQKKIWHSISLRQHISQRLKRIKGLIPFVGIDILNNWIIFVPYQNGFIRSNLYCVLETFFNSAAYTNLKKQVYD